MTSLLHRVEETVKAKGYLAPVVALALALVLTYGFEVFSFHLTMDEELFGDYSNWGYAETWVSQGRWAMAALTLGLPNPVVPALSTGIGIVLSGIASWAVCRRYLSMSPWESAFAAALAGTVPVLAFIFSFATIAYGIGVGNVLLVGYLAGISSQSWLRRGLGVLSLAVAIGIYDSFLVAGAALAIAYILKRTNIAGIALGLSSLVLAYLLSRWTGTLVQTATGVAQDSYVSRYFDFGGLLSKPAGHLGTAFSHVWQVISLSTERFGLHSPWLAIALGALLLLAILGILRRGTGLINKAFRLILLGGLILLPVVVEAVSPMAVLLRSMLYIPVIVLVLAGLAVTGLDGIPRRLRLPLRPLLAGIILLALLGQATISNRLFASSETTYALDRELVFLIGQEKDRLQHGDGATSLPLVVFGTHRWPENVLIPSRENLGKSFFSGGGGDGQPARDSGFLRSQGVNVRTPTPEETAGAQKALSQIPVYPESGWITIKNSVLILNFGSNPAN
jgi:hypothetical protein